MPPPHAHNAHPRDGRALYIKKPGCFQTLWTRCVDGTNCTEVAIVRCATRPCLRAIDPSVPLQAVGNHSHFRGRLPPVPADPEDENAPGQPLPLITPASHWSDNLRAGASPGPGGGNVTPPLQAKWVAGQRQRQQAVASFRDCCAKTLPKNINETAENCPNATYIWINAKKKAKHTHNQTQKHNCPWPL